MFAAELQRPIMNQRAGQQAGFAQYLEPVADAEHEPAVGDKLLHCLHHRTEPRDGAATEVVAVAESTRHNDGVRVAKRRFLVPDKAGRVAQHVAQRVDCVLVAVGRGELEDGEIHFDLRFTICDLRGEWR